MTMKDANDNLCPDLDRHKNVGGLNQVNPVLFISKSPENKQK
jgi:hypothetical protein